MFTRTHIVPEGHFCILIKNGAFYKLLEAGTHEISKFGVESSQNIPIKGHKIISRGVEAEFDIIDPYLAIANYEYGIEFALYKIDKHLVRILLKTQYEGEKLPLGEYRVDENNEEYQMILSGFDEYGIRVKSIVLKIDEEDDDAHTNTLYSLLSSIAI